MNNTEFRNKNTNVIDEMGGNPTLLDITRKWFNEASKQEYSYHFEWMGMPIIQFPQDIVAMQEIIWKTKPDLIIETGIARGGSIIFYASLLELLGHGEVLGIDIDIRQHNRIEIEKHPMYKRITMYEGSSVSQEMANRVYEFAKGRKNVMVILDSNHTHEHVAKELELYSPLVKKDGYVVVFDTVIEDMSEEFFPDRPWGKGDNPKTAVRDFLKNNDRFVIDETIHNKLLITVAPDGYLKCIKD